MKRIFLIGILTIFFLSLIPTIEIAQEKNMEELQQETAKYVSVENETTYANIKENTIEYVTSPKQAFENFIFFGDSRFVGMKNIIKDDVLIAETGMGYDYFINNLDDVLEYYNENYIIIIEFGINDLFNVDKYIEKVNELSNEYNICYLTIYPIDEEKTMANGYTITNQQINDFNNKLKQESNSNVLIVDTNSYLKETGFNTADGIHYDTETYTKIYNYIINNL